MLPLDAGAEVSLSWNTFRNAPGSADALDFDCTNTKASYRLVATFTPREDVPDFGAMEAVISLSYLVPGFPYPATPLQPFWHFERGGCNEGNIVLGNTMPADGGGIENPWALSPALFVELSYAPDSPYQGVGRLLATIIRTSPHPLTAGKEYFAFTLDVTMCGATSCPGCSDRNIGLSFDPAALRRVDGTLLSLLSSSDPGSEPWVYLNNSSFGAQAPQSVGAGSDHAMAVIAAANGDGSTFVRSATHDGTKFIPVPPRTNESPCDEVPARQRTWGTLKLMYR
jgi:hypothetical protein